MSFLIADVDALSRCPYPPAPAPVIQSVFCVPCLPPARFAAFVWTSPLPILSLRVDSLIADIVILVFMISSWTSTEPATKISLCISSGANGRIEGRASREMRDTALKCRVR